ncbi:conserved Plasmodium protein, unknown function [Plasmodium knowlesi strain H]|uniref:Uncharacterized protein n=3 Tax=Plasmodium knowlesi TaxID=5850 RepID=A0A5K1UZF1_PLAKH|nr:conserved Plasmodium protein, unknown function [Plasmodium knowlesi strain H]OTN66287.1 Uncharacterized protein PKNOH_S09521000 [Plasmodium knowlesi]CAA9986378.1 conserved Plasmodium protein, unknown function [Plasmodium knowlesi strain H]SBO25643.1 conserved Plasmodium protein, unknown function [Plasmodium knowlesi strain H]SBO28363.1 conserved Plasmodium protein, unknown function [Plasmodium knowlesi strain H]VVS75852.1 conserved Plasmodium protein, unknown function [Plasmodium knowlesi s|eukprot:XP_002257784.1 hypothetical protein, conserved in Plasmodium species [Plasmodium knowlesi strain H]
MKNSYDTYNYSSSIFDSPGKSSMLSTSSQNLSGTYGHSNLSPQNEMITSILEQCVQEWFPFLREHENEGTKAEGNKGTNINEEIKRLKNFYKGVSSPNFPLKKLGKMDRSISSLNDENDDEDIFYNSNSLYMNLLSGGEEAEASCKEAEARHEEGNSGGEEDNVLLSRKYSRAKTKTQSECQEAHTGRNALEENLFYDCIAEKKDAHNKDGSRNVEKCHRDNQQGGEEEEAPPVWSLQKIRNQNEDEKKNFYLQKCRDQMSEKKEHKLKQPLSLLQRGEDGKREEDNDSDDHHQETQEKEEKYKLHDRVNEPRGVKKNRSDYDGLDICSDNFSQSIKCEDEEEEEQYLHRKSDTRDPTVQCLSSKEADITSQGYLSNRSKEKMSNVSSKLANSVKGDNCTKRESVTREDYPNKSINYIIQEIKKEESKEKNFTMDSYGTVYLSICTKVLEKDVDYFLSPRILPNEDLLNEKKKIKEILKLYDKLFYSHFKFIPNKIYKETLRPIYSYYQNLKCTLGGGAMSFGSFDGKSRKSCSLSKDYEIERSTNYNSHDEIKSFDSRPTDSSEYKNLGSSSSAEYKTMGRSSNGEYTNLGSFSNLINDQNIKKLLLDVDDSKDISHLEKKYKYIYKDLVKLKSLLLKKRHYKNILFEYQKKFVQNNNRCVKTYRDIYPVEKEYKIYTQIKKETGDVINSINTNYKKHYLNG